MSLSEALNQTLLGHSLQALTILERAVAEGWRDYNNLVHDRRWDALRSEPRFDRLLRTLAKSVAQMSANLETSGTIESLQQLPPPDQHSCKD